MIEETAVVSVAYCGLCCADCSCVTCWGCGCCRTGGGSPRCQVRHCVQQRGCATCAECPEMDSCQHLNTLFNRVYDLVFRTRRKENLAEIRARGLAAFLEGRSRRR